ncbi:MAG TPA: type II toxin-antitoxin system HicB family antitoxin [Candidatus Paceibacterota bacterium]
MKGKSLTKTSKTHSFAVVYEADPDGGFVAFAPNLPGCHSQGDTLEEAEENIKEAIEVYMESLALHKQPAPQERKTFQGTVNVPVRIA